MKPERLADESPDIASAHYRWWAASGGLFLALVSLYFMYGGLALGLGSPFRPGTGAFPFFTGMILLAFSLTIIFRDLRGDGLAEDPDWISFFAIGAALSVFALASGRLGLVPAAFLTTVIASLPDRSLPLSGKAILGAVVAAGCWVLFIKLLGLPFDAFEWRW